MATHVYLIQAVESGRLKIGIASDPLCRLGTLQVGCPELLALRKTIPFDTRREAKTLEARLHHRFAPFHIHGEWFQKHTAITNYFDLRSQR